jgi:hypothetical protein
VANVAQDSYVNLDNLIDFYDSLGMDEPMFELSFMPSWLATDPTVRACFMLNGPLLHAMALSYLRAFAGRSTW